MIELRNVSKVFSRPNGAPVTAVDRVTFEVAHGETLCLIGTSGCGKTTTMKLMNRLLDPTSGSILVDGVSVLDVDPIALRRRMGYVVQRGGLFPHMTVARNVGLLCELEGWDGSRRRRRVDELLDLVRLPPAEYRSRFPSELSGGEGQRVGFARALALDPEYVLMDEPFGALDPITRDRIQSDFVELKDAVKKTIVLVTHDMAEAFRLGERIALMDAGRIVQIGTEAEFREQPASEFVEEFLRGHLAKR